MKIKAKMCREQGPLLLPEYAVDKVVEVHEGQFASFVVQPWDRYEFIERNNVTPYQDDSIGHCLLVLREDSADGVLVLCDGYGAASLAAYLTGARDMVQAQLERAADLIVRQGTEHTASGSWAVYFEELEEQLGLSSRPGSGLDTMLKETLERRPEVAGVNMANGAIETTFHPEFCKGLQSSTEKKKPELRVRDILPLLDGEDMAYFQHTDADTRVWAGDLMELTPTGQKDHIALLDARVTKITFFEGQTELMLTDVAPEELARFNEAYDDFQQAEQAMGPTM